MDRTDLFENTPVSGAVLKLCIPTMLSSIVLIFYNLADTFFVGMLNAPVQTAGITLISPLTLGFVAFTNLFGVGASSLMSRALGTKDYELVRRTSVFGFYCALASGLIVSLLMFLLQSQVLSVLGTDETTFQAASGYMYWTVILGAAPSIINVVLAYFVRSEGASLHASIGTMSGCILNILIDPVFILPWGLNMGAAGAGCPTLIFKWVACAYFIILLINKKEKNSVWLDIKKIFFYRKIVKKIFSGGNPAKVTKLMKRVTMVILNNLTAGFGEHAVAAMGIASKLQMIPINLNVGMTQGSMPIFGYNFSSKNYERLKKCVIFAIALTVAVILAISLGFIIFSKPLIRAFMNDDQVVEYGSVFLTGMCIAMPFMCMDYSAVGVFQGCGMGGRAFIFALIRKVILEIPALLILSSLFPLYGLPYASAFAEVIMCVIAVIILIRMFRNLAGGKKGQSSISNSTGQ